MTIRRFARGLALALVLASVATGAARAADDDKGGDDERKTFSFGARGGPWAGFLHAIVRYPVTFSGGLLGGGGSGRVSTSIDDYDIMPFGEVFLTTKYVSVYADVWYGHWADDSTIVGSFNFAGLAFSGSTPVHTSLDTLTAQGRLQVNPVALDFMELGVSVGARYLDATGTIQGTDPTTGEPVRARRGLEAPIPQVGASLTFFAGKVADIYLRARGMDLTYDHYAIRNLEGEAGVAFNIGDHFAIGGEYHLFYLDVEDRREDANGSRGLRVIARLQGPLAFLRLRF